jgi:predicted small metal-binding protein
VSYEFECKNVVPGCEGKVRGETEAETLQKAAEHAADAHGLAELDAATVEKVKAGIQPTG